MPVVRCLEERTKELEEVKEELQGQMQDLQEEKDYLKRQQLIESESRRRLRQETSQLAAENMV